MASLEGMFCEGRCGANGCFYTFVYYLFVCVFVFLSVGDFNYSYGNDVVHRKGNQK